MPELLLELLSEEIPARMQARAAEDLKRLVCGGLKEAGLAFAEARAYVTPRRLALVVDGVPSQTSVDTIVRNGPRVGSPDQAIQGFLRSVQRPSVAHEDIKVRKTKKGEIYVFEVLAAAKPTLRELDPLLIDALDHLVWPKSMRWAYNEIRWVRPLQNILAVFDGQTIALDYDLVRGQAFREIPSVEEWSEDTGPKAARAFAGIPRLVAGNSTSGHRFLAPDPITVKDFADYETKLRDAFVVLDREERKAIIAEGAAKLAKAEKLALKDDPGLLDEVAGLVEWPVVLMGTIDEAFMDLPPEVLTTSMRNHQKYFACLDKTGALANRFVVVAGTETEDGGAQVVAGNERVLRARLADARFFWDQDRKRSLASRAPELASMVFHAKLGSLDDKADRLQALAAELVPFVPGADVDRVCLAARLAKADLTSGMVGEFPELQGVMGRYYALADGEHAEVAEAIADHYAPLGPNDRCPDAPVSVAVALADKLDTLVGFWAIGETPTGSKDPYALRRAALGVIRLILENGLRLPLGGAIETARGLYRGLEGPPVIEPLLAFFADRLKVALKDKGVRHDLITAVFELGGEDDLVRLLARVGALGDFLETEDGKNLLTAYKRAENIVRIEEKRDKASYREDLSPDLLTDPVEKKLAEHLFEATSGANEAITLEDFTLAMAEMAKLRRPIDEFFDQVLVNAEDEALRANRLRLLSAIGDTLGQVADFSRIEG